VSGTIPLGPFQIISKIRGDIRSSTTPVTNGKNLQSEIPSGLVPITNRTLFEVSRLPVFVILFTKSFFCPFNFNYGSVECVIAP
jgi:hypothetical protein